MTRERYTAKSGHGLWRPILTAGELDDLMFDDPGWCLACGEASGLVEPDAAGVICEDCGEPRVYGITELVLRGVARVRV